MEELLSNSPFGVFHFDKNGTITCVNDEFVSIIGSSREDLVGMKMFERLKDDALLKAIRHALTGKTGQYEGVYHSVTAKKETPVKGIFVCTPDENGRITGGIGIFEDITLQKQNEGELKTTLGRYKALLDAIPDLMFVLDADGRFVDYHAENSSDLYADPTLFMGKRPEDILPPEVAAMTSERVKNILSTGKPGYSVYNLEMRGNVHHFESRGVPCGNGQVLSIVRDITDRIKTMDALRESEQKFRRLAENTSDGILMISSKKQICYTSPAYLKQLGYSEKEELERDSAAIYAIVHPDDRDAVFARILEAIEKKKEDLTYVYRVKHKEGHYIWREDNAKFNYDSHGNHLNTYVICRDITERKQTEAELIKAKEKAEESDRLKTAFLANMSHEIRTPMNGIMGFAELLKEQSLTGEEQQRYISIIEKSGSRMLSIINDIVDLSKIESGQMEVNIKGTNINRLVKNIYTSFKQDAEKKGIQLFFKNALSSDEAMIKTDHEKLFAILNHLVKNALKYTKDGMIEFGYEKRNRLIEFYVRDTGIGIAMDRQKAIFDRFIQADIFDKGAFQGAGLGLSIAKAYSEMLGGEIWVESTLGTGSVFYFTIPYHVESETVAPKTPISSIEDQHGTLRTLKILIAEDDETSDYLVTRALKKISREVIHVKAGNEAVEACQKHPDIDLVLMDIKMPEMDGYQATREIRKFDQQIVIIAQTAYALSGDKEMALEAGCNDYLPKPLKKEELIRLIGQFDFQKLNIQK